MKIINLWSGPRNISTAVMYSFAQRKDTKVIDEPLYGNYLRVTGLNHPGRGEIMDTVNCDGNDVIKKLFNEKFDKNILFLKQMAHHLREVDQSFVLDTQNVFLIRDPREVIASLINQLPQPTLRDTGLDIQYDLFENLRMKCRDPIVMDSKRLLMNPKKILKLLCKRLSIPYSNFMLNWEKGPIKEDGIWAKYWYHEVHNSEGFLPYKKKKYFPDKFNDLENQCQPYYKFLLKHALE